MPSAGAAEVALDVCGGHGILALLLLIFKKAELHREAAKVLIEYIQSIERAVEFAERVDVEEVWVMLGKAQRGQELVTDAIGSFIKANDATEYVAVIGAADGAADDVAAADV